jgi:hypothetical protein
MLTQDVDIGGTQGRGADEIGRDGHTQGLSLSLSLSPSLSRALVTPTTSTPVQDNISLIPSLVFHLASTHLGRGTQQQIHWSVDGPRGSETPTSVGKVCRGMAKALLIYPCEGTVRGYL